jgi:N utilization substance protein B
MQLIYSRNANGDTDNKDLIKQYKNSIEGSFELYLFTLFLIQKVASFARLDADKRHSKYLPKEEDLNFSAILYENECMQSLVHNEHLQKIYKKLEFDKRIDEDVLKEVYRKYAKEESYLNYVYAEHNKEAHVEALLDLFRFVKKDDIFTEALKDQYYSWEDDKSLVVGAIKKTLKSLPVKGAFFAEYNADEDTVEVFGLKLLKLIAEKEQELLELITPNLVNWDADRLAQVDLILLKMGLCEMLFFPTIPTKVTLNEYVEISKLYSTPKSKEFINGILDKLMKKLQAEGKIVKEGKGLVD